MKASFDKYLNPLSIKLLEWFVNKKMNATCFVYFIFYPKKSKNRINIKKKCIRLLFMKKNNQ